MIRPPGSYLRKARLAGSLLGASLLGRRSPAVVAWCLTSRCNLRCITCRRPELGAVELSHGRMLEICDELIEAGAARVALTGGEALCHPLCVEIAGRLAAGGVDVNLNSNGAMLVEYLPRLQGALAGVTLSLDGPRAQHDQVRGEGSFEQVVGAVLAIQAAGLPVELHTTLTALNVQRAEQTLDLALELGTRIGFSPVEEVPAPDAETYARLKPTPRQWRDAVDMLLARQKGGCRGILNSPAGLRYLRNWPRYAPIRCAAGLVYARIEPDGGVYGCGHLVRHAGAPSLAQVSFSEAFAALEARDCRACWCDTRVEMNLVLSGTPSALLQIMRR